MSTIHNKSIKYRNFQIEIANHGGCYGARIRPIKPHKPFRNFLITFDMKEFEDINEGISYWKSQVDNYLDRENQ